VGITHRKSPLSPEKFDLLIDSYRTDPGNYTRAAEQSQVNWRTAKKAWNKGLKGHYQGKPIKAVLHEEVLEARAIRERDTRTQQAAQKELQDKIRSDAKKDAIKARAQEGQIVTLARTNSLQALAIGSQLLAMARGLVPRVQEYIDKVKEPFMVDCPNPVCGHTFAVPIPKLTPTQALSIVERSTRLSHSINSQAHEAMVMERMHLGEPAHIIGISGDRDQIPLAEAEKRVQAAAAAIAAAKEKGWSVLDGGKLGELHDAASATMQDPAQRQLIGKPVHTHLSPEATARLHGNEDA